MPGKVPSSLEIASLQRRLAAGLIDLALVLPIVAGAGVIAFKWPARRSKRQQRDLLGPDPERWRGRLAKWSPALTVFGFVYGVTGRNWRGPGARMLGLRLVDGRTGGPVTVRSALIKQSVHLLLRSVDRMTTPDQRKDAKRMEAIEPELRELPRRFADDREAMERETAKLFREHNVNPLRSCLPTIAIHSAIRLPAFLASNHQSLEHRLAGIIVVVDR